MPAREICAAKNALSGSTASFWRTHHGCEARQHSGVLNMDVKHETTTIPLVGPPLLKASSLLVPPIEKLPMQNKHRGRLKYQPHEKRGKVANNSGKVVRECLSSHPEKGANVPIITEKDATVLNPLFIAPPPKGEVRRVKIEGRGDWKDLSVLFVPKSEEMEKATAVLCEQYDHIAKVAPEHVKQDDKGGKYVSHGFGCHPGKHTTHYLWGTNSKGEPKSNPRPHLLGVTGNEKKDALLDSFMDTTAAVMGLAAKDISNHFPGILRDMSDRVRGKGTLMEDVFVYPRPEKQVSGSKRKGGAESIIPSHAVAVRLEGLVGFHADTDDAPRDMGSPMIYSSRGRKRNRASDLIIFADRYGGTCVRVQVQCEHHTCYVMFDASKHPHSNILQDQDACLGGQKFVRIVPYCKQNIDNYLECYSHGMPSDGVGGPQYHYRGQSWAPARKRTRPTTALTEGEQIAVHAREERLLSLRSSRQRAKTARSSKK